MVASCVDSVIMRVATHFQPWEARGGTPTSSSVKWFQVGWFKWFGRGVAWSIDGDCFNCFASGATISWSLAVFCSSATGQPSTAWAQHAGLGASCHRMTPKAFREEARWHELRFFGDGNAAGSCEGSGVGEIHCSSLVVLLMSWEQREIDLTKLVASSTCLRRSSCVSWAWAIKSV